ncbi:MAG TPA: metallophosphoesterase [Tenuifilaceae bacterium]|nr:metallophosphoesterase [Tenuifilaceae bacterium]
MKIYQLVIFLTIVLSIYFSVNIFLYYQTRPLFNLPSVGTWLKVIFWVLVLSYPIGRTFEAFFGGFVLIPFVKLGSMWIAAMLYLTLLFVVFWLIVPVLAKFGLNIKGIAENRQIAVIFIYLVMLIILLAGYINATNPKVSNINIDVNKPLPTGKVRIAMVSDIHLGTIIGKKELAKLVNTVNKQNPDLVLFVGDVFDEDITPVVNGNMGNLFEQIKSKYGVYAVTGNHEFFGNYTDKISYLKKHKITVLCDTALTVNSINIIGRYDRQSIRALGHLRKSLVELTKNIDLSKFTILMDHQPANLNEAVNAGIDLQLSGHTHNGQMWPLNYITKAIYEVSMGYKKKGNTHFYVSPGYGTWGPRIRLGNRPEIVVITVNENEK